MPCSTSCEASCISSETVPGSCTVLVPLLAAASSVTAAAPDPPSAAASAAAPAAPTPRAAAPLQTCSFSCLKSPVAAQSAAAAAAAAEPASLTSAPSSGVVAVLPDATSGPVCPESSPESPSTWRSSAVKPPQRAARASVAACSAARSACRRRVQRCL